MAEYNPSKIIKDGNTYNFRDTTKIPLAGSNAISGSLIPATDNSIDVGSSTKNIKMLYAKGITINGTQFLPSNFVDLTTAQTIGGGKTFSNLRTYFGRDISFYSRAKYGKNLNPVSTSYQYIVFSGNIISDGPTNQWDAGYIEQVVNTNGSSCGRWHIQDTAENYVGLELWVEGNDKQVRPLHNGNTDLGTTNRKWKSLNGINPGALSLPGVSNVNIDTTDWDVTLSNNILGSFTPAFDGWALIQLNPINADTDIWIIGGTMRTNYKTAVNPANNSKFIMCYFPVLKNYTYNIYGYNASPLSSVSIARLYPCQGNV